MYVLLYVAAHTHDVQCPSICCEYILSPLVNKEADFTNNWAE